MRDNEVEFLKILSFIILRPDWAVPIIGKMRVTKLSIQNVLEHLEKRESKKPKKKINPSRYGLTQKS